MELFFVLLSVLILGISSALISYLLDFCFAEGNIFDWYYLFIEEKIKPNNYKLFKVLGGCNICFNIWVSSGIFLLFNLSLGLAPIFYIPFIGFSFITSYYLNFKLNINE